MQNQNQLRFGRTCFPALGAGYVYLLWVLIGSLWCLCSSRAGIWVRFACCQTIETGGKRDVNTVTISNFQVHFECVSTRGNLTKIGPWETWLAPERLAWDQAPIKENRRATSSNLVHPQMALFPESGKGGKSAPATRLDDGWTSSFPLQAALFL